MWLLIAVATLTASAFGGRGRSNLRLRHIEPFRTLCDWLPGARVYQGKMAQGAIAPAPSALPPAGNSNQSSVTSNQ